MKLLDDGYDAEEVGDDDHEGHDDDDDDDGDNDDDDEEDDDDDDDDDNDDDDDDDDNDDQMIRWSPWRQVSGNVGSAWTPDWGSVGGVKKSPLS